MMSEAEVRTMDSEQLAQYALESKIANYVAETIKTNEIDGDLAYALNEEDISEFAGKSGVQKKRLLSAIGKLPRDGGGPDSVELMATAAEELEGEARELFARYDNNDDAYLDLGEFTVLLSNELGIPPDDVAPVFDEFDDDHDGKISFAEFVKHHNALVERQQRRTRGTNPTVTASQAVKTGRTLAGMFPKGKRIAVVFACDDYTGSEHDGKDLNNLKCAVKDAELFRDTVKQAGFEIFSYKVNEQCTRDTMQSVLDDVVDHFKETVTIAQFIFYYAGHGVKDHNKKGWFALHKYNSAERHTKFKMSALKVRAREIGAIQQLYVLDCCHAGELFGRSRGVKETFAMELASKPCVYGITAVTGDQLAEEEGENGIFTKTLCYGIGERQAAMGNKPYATSNDLLEFVQIRVHEKTNNRMQPLGEKMLHDHYDAPCNGQFVMFHEETIRNLAANANAEEEAVVRPTTNIGTRGVGTKSPAKGPAQSVAAFGTVQAFVNSIEGVKIKTPLGPTFAELQVATVADLASLPLDKVESTILPRLKPLERKRWAQGDVIGNAKKHVAAKLAAIEESAASARTVQEWLTLLPASAEEAVKAWLVEEYGVELDDGLDDVVAMEQEFLGQLVNAVVGGGAHGQAQAQAALLGLYSGNETTKTWLTEQFQVAEGRLAAKKAIERQLNSPADWDAVEKVVGKEAADQMKQGEEFTGTLDICKKQITDEGCKILAPALIKMTGLTRLDLDQNQYGDEGLQFVAPALRTMPNLKELFLGDNNNIGDEGCRTIAPALRTMPNLEQLDLQNNNIGDEGLAVLSNVVPAIPLLYYLDLTGNKIGNVGCQCLLELIENDSLQSLTYLNLHGNWNISSEELKTKFKRVWREKGKGSSLYF